MCCNMYLSYSHISAKLYVHTLSSSITGESPLNQRELFSRSLLHSLCALVISFPEGAATRMVCQAFRALSNLLPQQAPLHTPCKFPADPLYKIQRIKLADMEANLILSSSLSHNSTFFSFPLATKINSMLTEMLSL